ncbi:CRISPR-associated protein Cas2, partial [Neisseria arctica]
MVRGRDSLQNHYTRLCANLPEEGSIRSLEGTEKQFASMHLLLVRLKTQDKRVNADQLLLFGLDFF